MAKPPKKPAAKGARGSAVKRGHKPPTRAAMDQYLKKVQGLIDAHGWMIQSIMGQTIVAYTVGLVKTHTLPEVVITGVDPETASSVLNTVARRLVSKELILEENKLFDDIFEGFSARFKPLPASQTSLLKIATLFSPTQTPVAAWQLMWPDQKGVFPGETGMDEKLEALQNLELVMTQEDADTAH